MTGEARLRDVNAALRGAAQQRAPQARMDQASVDARDRVLAAHARIAQLLPGRALPWLVRARRGALARFADTGFPTTRDEAWKYTNPAPLGNHDFAAVSGPIGDAAALERDVARLALDGCHRLVFVDGRHAPALSDLRGVPAGVTIRSLADALDGDADLLEPLFGDAAHETIFGALNAAFAPDGAWVHVPAGVALDKPLQLLFLATAAGATAAPRILIAAESGARLAVIEHYAGPAGSAYLTNAVTRLTIGRGADVEHAKLQQEGARAHHVAGIHAVQQATSRFVSRSIALGASLARNDIATEFAGEGCAAALDGLYVMGGRQHVDHHTRIDHAQPKGTSREHYRGILDGASRAVFAGRVIVRPDAQHTDAQQTNHNLLLSRDAEVDTKPQLEIWADDVKCSHGATVGSLDEAQLFYLRSRGIEEGPARGLLIRAFAHDIVERIAFAPLRTRLAQALQGRLPHGGSLDEIVGVPADPASAEVVS